MESAKLIAVKEVELDTENDEKAKQVKLVIVMLCCVWLCYHSNSTSYNWRLISCVA